MSAQESTETTFEPQDDDDEPCGIPLFRGSALVAGGPDFLLPLVTTRGELRRKYEEEDREKAKVEAKLAEIAKAEVDAEKAKSEAGSVFAQRYSRATRILTATSHSPSQT